MTDPSDVSSAQTDLRDYAWDYFQLHANQRLATFNFFIAVSTLVATGVVTSFHRDINMPFLGIILGLLLMVFSYIFYRLDERNRVLVHYGEEAPKLFEREIAKKGIGNDLTIIGNDLTMFLTEEQQTKEVNSNRSHFAQILRPYTYTNCFCAIFWTYGAIGTVGIYVAVYKTFLS